MSQYVANRMLNVSANICITKSIDVIILFMASKKDRHCKHHHANFQLKQHQNAQLEIDQPLEDERDKILL